MKRYCLFLQFIFCWVFLYAQSSKEVPSMEQFERGFIENRGQFKRLGDSDSNFILSMFSEGSLSVWLTKEGLSYVFSKDLSPKVDSLQPKEQLCRTDIRFLDASLSKAQIVYEDPLPYTFNYITQVGSKGIYDVKIYRRVRVHNIYTGIDYILRFDAQGNLKQEFEVGEGVDYKQIRFTVENAQKVQIRAKKNLRIVQRLGEINETDAISYALIQTDKSYPTSYRKRKGVYGFEVKNRQLEAIIIDPHLEWATYFDEATGKKSQLTDICVDEKKGGLYVCGWTAGAAFPYKEKEGASQWQFEQIKFYNANSLIIYFDSTKQIQWCTFYGVDAWSEQAQSIAMSEQGHLFCVGYALLHEYNEHRPIQEPGYSTDIPPLYTLEKEGAYQSIPNARTFILEFDEHNRIEWASFFGVRIITDFMRDTLTMNISPLDISTSTKDELYIVARSMSTEYYAVLCPKESESTYFQTHQTGFIGKFDKKRAWVWGTTFGNDGVECIPFRIIVDSIGNLWIGSVTTHNGPLFTKKGAYNQVWSAPDTLQCSGLFKGYFDFDYTRTIGEEILEYRNANKELCLSKFTSKGILTWSTAIGGKWEEELRDMKIARNGHVFLTGFTRSKDFPMCKKAGAFNQYYSSGRNAFLMEFSMEGELLWSTHLPKIDSALTTSSNASALCITPDNGIYIMGTGPIRDEPVDPRSHSPKGRTEMEMELGLYEHTSPNVNIMQYLRSVVDSTYSPSFCMYFSPDGELLLWDSLPFYGNEVKHDQFRAPSKFSFNELCLLDFPFQDLQIDSRGKIWGLLSRWGNTSLVDSKDGSYFARNPKPYPQTSDLLFRYNNCFNTYAPDRLGNGDTLYCPQSPITLCKPARFHEYRSVWSTGATSDSLLISSPANYYLALYPIYPHCPILYSDTLRVDSIPTPLLNFPTDTLYFCVGEKLYLDATHLGASYLWYNGRTDSAIFVEYQGDSLIHAWCRVSNLCGDTVFDTAVVRYVPPYIYLGLDTVLCHYDSLFIDAAKYNGELPCLYTWYINGDSVSNKSQYTLSRIRDSLFVCVKVSLADSPGSCIAWDTLYVRYYSYPDIHLSMGDTTYCVGTVLALDAKTHGSTSPDAQYRWYAPWGDIYSEKALAHITDTGIFTIWAKNYCSEAITTLHIGYVPTIWTQINLPLDTLVCLPNSCTLDVSVPYSGTSYEWADGNRQSERNFNSGGTHTVTLIDEMGCSQAHTITIQIEDCPIEVDFPNVFTPNGDGVNDLFIGRSLEQMENFEMSIFNSWGLSVYKYKGDPQQMEWNGRMHNRGSDVPDGAYFWIITCKDLLGRSKRVTGCVMVLR